MSTSYNDTVGKKGLIQLIERNCGFSDGEISGNATLLALFTADINIALDKALSIIFKSAGKWQFDDNNQTDYPFITTNIVSGQRDYSFTTDGSGNIILDIYRVMVAGSTGVYKEIYPVDQESRNVNSGILGAQSGTLFGGSQTNTDSFIDGRNTSGTPYRYDLTANGIFLDPVPNYSYATGLKVFINREASYFNTGDTTKKPGFAGLFHEYLALRPSYQYAYRKSLTNVKALQNEMLTMEAEITSYYAARERGVPKRMRANIESNK